MRFLIFGNVTQGVVEGLWLLVGCRRAEWGGGHASCCVVVFGFVLLVARLIDSEYKPKR